MFTAADSKKQATKKKTTKKPEEKGKTVLKRKQPAVLVPRPNIKVLERDPLLETR